MFRFEAWTSWQNSSGAAASPLQRKAYDEQEPPLGSSVGDPHKLIAEPALSPNTPFTFQFWHPKNLDPIFCSSTKMYLSLNPIPPLIFGLLLGGR